MATKKKTSEVRPEIQTPVKVFIQKRGKAGCVKKVLPSRIVNEEEVATTAGCSTSAVADILNAVIAHVKMGHDVVLCGGLRFYGCLDKDGAKLNLVSQTIGTLRTCLNEVKFIAVRRNNNGVETIITNRDASKLIAASNHDRREHTSPECVVTCPQCGFEFRVGKKLQ